MKKATVDVSRTFQRALPENNNRSDVKIERSKPIRFRYSIITAFCPATRVIKENNNRGDVKIERSKPIRFRNSIITAFYLLTSVVS